MILTYEELNTIVVLLKQEEAKLRKDREEAHAALKIAEDAFSEWANENAPVPQEAKNIHVKMIAPLKEECERKDSCYYPVKSALEKITDTAFEL